MPPAAESCRPTRPTRRRPRRKLTDLQRAAKAVRRREITPTAYDRMLGKKANRAPSYWWAEQVRHHLIDLPPAVDDPANVWCRCGPEPDPNKPLPQPDPRLYPAYYVARHFGRRLCADCGAYLLHARQKPFRDAGVLGGRDRGDAEEHPTAAALAGLAVARQALVECDLAPEDEASLLAEIAAGSAPVEPKNADPAFAPCAQRYRRFQPAIAVG